MKSPRDRAGFHSYLRLCLQYTLLSHASDVAICRALTYKMPHLVPCQVKFPLRIAIMSARPLGIFFKNENTVNFILACIPGCFRPLWATIAELIATARSGDQFHFVGSESVRSKALPVGAKIGGIKIYSRLQVLIFDGGDGSRD
jgi:hypothetical protein